MTEEPLPEEHDESVSLTGLGLVDAMDVNETHVTLRTDIGVVVSLPKPIVGMFGFDMTDELRQALEDQGLTREE